MDRSDHETGVHDLALGVIHALKVVDVKALSYVQLRRLYASLVHTGDLVGQEIAERSGTHEVAEVVRRQPPRPD